MNPFQKAWLEASEDPKPTRVRGVRAMDWGDFRALVDDGKEYFAQTLVGSLMLGDVWIFKRAFSKEFVRDMKEGFVRWTNERPDEFHKMLEGVPDFHRRITPDRGKLYTFEVCKHSAYFFRWNEDPLNLWPTISDRWRVLKAAMGLEPETYEKNTPKDGVVDRIQIVRYLPTVGWLEPHSDPDENQKCFISGYLSKKGVDYQGGGFYALGLDDKPVDLEKDIDVGDLAIGYATVVHGVNPCDVGKEARWDSTDGRWFLGLYSASSDCVEKRATGHPIRPGVTV